MGIAAGFCTLKAQFIPLDIAFESARFNAVKRWDFIAKDSQANWKEWNNGLIKLSKTVKVYTHPFALNVSMKLQGIIAILSVVLSGADIQKSSSSGIVILAGKYGILD